MKHGLSTSLVENKSDCLVVGLFGDDSEIILPLHAETKALLTGLMTKLREPGDTVYQADHHGHSVLLIHCGDRKSYQPADLTKYITQVTKKLIENQLSSALIAMPLLDGHGCDWQLEQMIVQVEAQCYQFLTFKTKNKRPNVLESLQWYLLDASESTIATAHIIAGCTNYVRDLANAPSNICTPSYLAKQAHAVDIDFDTVSSKVLDKRAMEELGMGALLAVSKGSIEPPQLIHLKYNGDPSSTEAPIVLVGKGITFDSGGISLKPASGMEEMKFDMSGAATVLGVIKACALLKLPITVIGLLACAENMPSGSATKPGDVVTSMSGQTIEIINTDAEGRLVLADALTYAKQFRPKFVIDIATLTGAVIIALGHEMSGIMSNDDELVKMLEDAALQSQDKIWRLPLDPAFQELINSPIADIANSTASRVAGSITAGCFLSRFTESFRWAHLDIAGTAWVPGSERCATGRPVALLVQFLRNIVSHAR